MAPRLTSSYTTPISHAVPQPAVPNPTRDNIAAGGGDVDGVLGDDGAPVREVLVGSAVGVLAVGRALAGALVPRGVGDAVTCLVGNPVLGLSVLAAAGESVSARTGAADREGLSVGAVDVNGAPVVLLVGAVDVNGAPVVLGVGAVDVNGAPVVLLVGALVVLLVGALVVLLVGALVVLRVGALVEGLPDDDVGRAVGCSTTTGPVAVGALDESCTMMPPNGLAVGPTMEGSRLLRTLGLTLSFCNARA